jgi:DNA-binding transcriptional regulator YbjK
VTAASTAGRPRDPAIGAAVLSTTVELLREGGYAALAWEKVAARRLPRADRHRHRH